MNLISHEQEKMNSLRAKYGITKGFARLLFNLSQGGVLIIWAGLVQRFAFNIEDYPEMITGGFLWFKDLSVPDPYFILPLLNCTFAGLSIYVL